MIPFILTAKEFIRLDENNSGDDRKLTLDMNKHLRILVFSFAVFMLQDTCIFADTLNPLEKGIFELKHIALEVFAAEDSMQYLMRISPVDKTERKELFQHALSDLTRINGQLIRLDLSEKLDPFKSDLINLIRQLKVVHAALEANLDEKIEEALYVFRDKAEAYNKKFNAYADAHLNFTELPKDFDIEKTGKGFLDDNDKIVFEQIILLIRSKEYKEAHDKLENLLTKYKGSPVEGSIVSRIIECRQKPGSILQEEISPDESLKSLNEFIESSVYSSRLYNIFEQWRTLEQSFNYGESNWSFVPNQKYIQKRWCVVQDIEKYLAKNPDDVWAKRQIALLMDLPLIQRGGILGNTNMFYRERLFGDGKSSKGNIEW